MENERFSEFSYGFVLTDELINWHGTPLTTAPVFPSLQKEGQTGGGYDVKLPGIPLFLQFKLSHRMQKNSAKEIKTSCGLKTKFFRMYLRPRNRSKQHQLLLDLESGGNLVFYAAPAFFETSELDQAYLNRQVAKRSVFVRPSAIGPLNDDQKHHISFQNAAATLGYFFSDPVRPRSIELTRETHLREIVRTGLGTSGRGPLNNDMFAEIAKTMIIAIKERFNEHAVFPTVDVFAVTKVLNPIQQVAYFAQVFFDSTLFIVQERKK